MSLTALALVLGGHLLWLKSLVYVPGGGLVLWPEHIRPLVEGLDPDPRGAINRPYYLHYPALFVINYFFDVLTVLVTLYVVRRIATLKGLAHAFVLIVLDVGAALLLAFCCLVSIEALFYLPMGISPADIPLLAGRYTEAFLTSLVRQDGRALMLTQAFYACTTFLPTAAFMAALLVLLVAKPVIVFFKAISKIIIERAAESPPSADPERIMPFTILGTLFGLIGLVAKAAYELAKLLADSALAHVP